MLNVIILGSPPVVSDEPPKPPDEAEALEQPSIEQAMNNLAVSDNPPVQVGTNLLAFNL